MAFNFPDAPTFGQNFQGWIWDGEKWDGNTPVPNPATASPIIDGSASIGTSVKYAREDHIHPSDVNARGVRYDAAQGLTSAQMSQGRANIAVTKRNYIINGGMQVSQENGATAGATSGYYPVDQFNVNFSTTTGAYSASQNATPTPGGSPVRLRVVVTVADVTVGAADLVWVEQRVEGLRIADLMFGTTSAKTVTVQFGVRASAGTYSLVLESSGAGNRSYVAEYTISAGEALTDVVRSITIPGDITGTWPKDSLSSLFIRWGLMAGSTYQKAAGSWSAQDVVGSTNQSNWMAAVNNEFQLFDVSLTEGSVAPPFQLPDYPSELALCQRYYETTYPVGNSPGTAYGSNTNSGPVMCFLQAACAFPGMIWEFKTRKRTTPTITIYSPWTGASGKIRDQNGAVDVAATYTTLHDSRCYINVSSVAVTAANNVFAHATASARL